MARYRYLVADLRSGLIREEIPFATASYTFVLNRPGAFSATIGLRHPKATKTNLAPGSTAIHVERDGAIVWSGILWTAKASASSESLAVAAEGWWSYFRRRLIRTTKTYTQVDQLAIVRDLINYAQSDPNGNIGVVVGSETSGVLRDRTFNDYERKPIGEAVEQLAAVAGGFDFSIDVGWQAGQIVKTLRLWYPRRGAQTTLVFELGANLEDLDEEVDAATQANRVDAIGSGDAAAMLIATSTSTAALATYPLLETTVAFKDVTVQATLQGHADLAVTNWAYPIDRLPMLVAHEANPDTRLGNYVAGDSVRVRGHAGWLDVDRMMRIQEYGVAIDTDGREKVGLAFIPEEAAL